jgi:PQQ-dependent catabolism-associated CXXCW motif protein
MRRQVFAAGACIALTGCIVQQPQSPYWARPYSQGYAPSPYAQAGYGQAPSPYGQPPRAPYSPQPYAPQPYSPQGQASYAPQVQEAAYSPQPTDQYAAPPREEPRAESQAAPPAAFGSSDESGSEPRNPRATFADETIDYGVPPTNTIREHDFDAPTPTHVQGARTVTTLALQSMLASDRPPLMIDVIRGAQTVSIPNSVWLRDAGTGRHLDDDIQAWLDMQLSNLTGRDKSRPLVIFCASRMCWLAYNATLRAVDLGYTDVFWYRGGRDSWQAAGLPMTPVTPPPS